MTIEPFAGRPTYWSRTGDGPRQALMVHCSLAHSGAWRGVQKRLSDDFTMLAFDLPGHGRSADWEGEPEYQDVSVEIAEALLEREADGPLDLIGHSFGATIALRLAQRVPDRVRSLTLFEPVLFAAAKAHLVFAENLAYMNGPFADAMRAGDRMEAARLFNVMWGRSDVWQSLPQAQRDDMAKRIHLIPAGKVVTHDDIHEQAAPGALEALKFPVLLMEGANSPEIARVVLDVMERRLPNATRRVIANAAHMAPVTHPELVANAILEFVNTQAPV
ncbi:alpha/beta fold hydrolase [Aliiroseovarius sp. 2305UL8-7]|uniref:alpha/beta fold hydrolase n=1 Tax=Aliiroseovarius conchicola TaxID=3121637 RepID=UPI003527B44B